ncbi:hypothetical protein FIT77_04170 [Candidatus Methylopumilus universalis]|uniref:hypothetical protein n=1 Tax=Candidatus Methylopumilus universalis TaxID=2588536 RepID=UPI0011203083|nr:hypothetical protein [Candidatus Methylopumilus universalis]QDC96495.1 hypothetical protein FIT77_04170 [Candidatus Methylopumilus universalis]
MLNKKNKSLLQKVDIAVQSYKKPESLVYALLSLHQVSKNQIEQVWINDDKSGDDVVNVYKSESLKKALHPWKIHVRVNERRMGWWLSFVRGYKPDYLTRPYQALRMMFNFYKNRSFYVGRQDIRYQWAIDSTDKSYIFIMHDDIVFKGDVVGLYLKNMLSKKKPSIVGDLGQCWRCSYQQIGCKPHKILKGYRPHSQWPNTQIKENDHRWACRINEWSCMLSVSAAQKIEEKYQIFFGNFDNKGDTSAYWFSCAVRDGYEFDDPILAHEKDDYYLHWENGITGHSAWSNQGFGLTTYNKNELRQKLKKEFGFVYSWTNTDEC